MYTYIYIYSYVSWCELEMMALFMAAHNLRIHGILIDLPNRMLLWELLEDRLAWFPAGWHKVGTCPPQERLNRGIYLLYVILRKKRNPMWHYLLVVSIIHVSNLFLQRLKVHSWCFPDDKLLYLSCFDKLWHIQKSGPNCPWLCAWQAAAGYGLQWWLLVKFWEVSR